MKLIINEVEVSGISPVTINAETGLSSKLFKTGQTVSYATGDDGDLELGMSKSYTVLTVGQYAGTTNITVNSKTHALSNNCVRDNRTGLMWARYVPTADIGPAADGKLFWEQWTLTSNSATFNAAGKTITAAAGTPYDTLALCAGRKFTVTGSVSNNGTYTVANISTTVITTVEALVNEGPVAISIATVDDLIWDALDQANANALGGYSDWRIPNYFELPSIFNLGNCNPSIDTTVFPSTPATYHWTSSTNPCGAASAFAANFSLGVVSNIVKETRNYYVRFVRG